jgi:hypothetical protein
MKKTAQRALLVIVLGGGSLLTMAWAQPPAAPVPPTAVASPADDTRPSR